MMPSRGNGTASRSDGKRNGGRGPSDSSGRSQEAEDDEARANRATPSVRECRRCLLPEGVLHTELDGSGLCNRCRHWDATKAFVLDVEANRPLLLDRLDRDRGRFHYDAAVGLSGGKDSTYVLHRMTSDYGRTPLAITFDNGFLTDNAWMNVRRVVHASGVDHFVYRPDWGAFREFYLATLRRFGDPCIACSIGGYILSIRGCRDLRIPFFIHGRSPMQMLRDWYPNTRDPGVPILRGNLAPYSPDTLRRRYAALERRMGLFLLYLVRNVRLQRRILHELFGSGLRPGQLVPEFLAFFLFEPYDEDEIIRHLEGSEIGFLWPSHRAGLGHGDCLIHDVCAHLYEQRHGISRVLPDVAAMLRQGAITKERAREIVAANSPSHDAIEVSIGHLIERLEIERSEFDAIVSRLRRRRGHSPFE